MENKQQKFPVGIGGGVAGGILGGLLGSVLGPLLAGVPRQPSDSPFALFDSCFGFVFALIGAVVGGVLCMIGGAALSVWSANHSIPAKHSPDESPSEPIPIDTPVTSEELMERELEQLKARIAELEIRKNTAGRKKNGN